MLLVTMIIIGAYVLGSINAGIVLSKLLDFPDPRSQGSKNPGATNVLRVAGKRSALITLMFDIIKGVIPVLVAKCFGLTAELQAVVALSAMLGHMFPVFFGFRGGKGVATAFGAVFALAWPLGLSMFALWLLVMVVTRYVSLSSVLASLGLPFIAYVEHYTTMVWPLSVMGLLIILRHYPNIRRLQQGTETRFSFRSRLKP